MWGQEYGDTWDRCWTITGHLRGVPMVCPRVAIITDWPLGLSLQLHVDRAHSVSQKWSAAAGGSLLAGNQEK